MKNLLAVCLLVLLVCCSKNNPIGADPGEKPIPIDTLSADTSDISRILHSKAFEPALIDTIIDWYHDVHCSSIIDVPNDTNAFIANFGFNAGCTIIMCATNDLHSRVLSLYPSSMTHFVQYDSTCRIVIFKDGNP